MTEDKLKEWKMKAKFAKKKSTSGGIKFDDEKPDYSLVPPNALEDIVKVLTIGAKKYDRHNWKKLDNLHDRYFAAAQRHLWALQKTRFTIPKQEYIMQHTRCVV